MSGEQRKVRMVSWDAQEALFSELSSAAEAGTLTPTMLADAIYSHYEHLDGPTASVGAHWIFNHPAEFGQALGSGLLGFLREHANAPYFLDLLILAADVVALVPNAERVTFWREAYAQKGARNYGWINAMRAGGVADSAIQVMILDRLRAITPEMMAYANDLDCFLTFGDGSLGYEAIRIRQEQSENGVPLSDQYRPTFSKDFPWGVLTDEQFVSALEICVQQSPIKVVSLWRKLMLRTSQEVVYRLCEGVLSNASALNWSAENVRPFSLECRLALARKMSPVNEIYVDSQANVVDFLLDCFFDLAPKARSEFWQNLERVLAPANGAAVYRAMNKRRSEWEIFEVAVIVDVQTWLVELLDRTGYKLGRIVEGSYLDRQSGQSRRQFQVWIGRAIYVQDRGTHRYFPRKDDQVLFRPASGNWLTPVVCAVHFIPVDPSRES